MKSFTLKFSIINLYIIQNFLIGAVVISPKSVKNLQQILGLDLYSIIQTTADEAYNTWSSKATSFVYPTQMQAVFEAYNEIGDYNIELCGGFNSFDKCKMIFNRRNDYEKEVALSDPSSTTTSLYTPPLCTTCDEYLTAIRLRGSNQIESFSHQEIIHGLTHELSISPNQYGDIVIESTNKAQLVVDPLITTTIQSWKKIGNIPLEIDIIPISELIPKKIFSKELTTVEASTRIDAVASAGYSISRNKMMSLIESGQVMLNWKEINKVYNIQEGSCIHIHGLGKLSILQVTETNKGRYKVKMIKSN